MSKLNCWEFMICKRENRGEGSKEKGLCAAATDSSCDGINNGKNAGRICWAVAGAFCCKMIRDQFAHHSMSCTSCNFFKLVKQEEGEGSFKFMKE